MSKSFTIKAMCTLVTVAVASTVVSAGLGIGWHATGDRRWFLGLGVPGEVALHKRFEYQADSFAEQAGYGKDLSSALMKITVGDTGAWSMTHPSTDKRVTRMEGVSPVRALRGLFTVPFEVLRTLAI